MHLSNEELVRISEEIYTDRRISSSTYCGRCGYNLRTLPYVGTCPECGSDYNARPLKWEGIFTAEQVRFPFSTLLGVFVTAVAAVVFVITTLGVSTPLSPAPAPVAPGVAAPAPPSSPALDGVGVVIAVVLAAMFLLYVWLAARQLCAFWRGLSIARRIAKLESDET